MKLAPFLANEWTAFELVPGANETIGARAVSRDQGCRSLFGRHSNESRRKKEEEEKEEEEEEEEEGNKKKNIERQIMRHLLPPSNFPGNQTPIKFVIVPSPSSLSLFHTFSLWNMETVFNSNWNWLGIGIKS